MYLTKEEEKILAGEEGNAAAKSMKILVALGEIYRAEKLIPVGSVQVAGVSYHNLGDAGLEYLAELAKDGQVKVLTMLNPAGMDLENWKNLGISPEFAKKQELVIEAFAKMGITTTCTCTPYLIGNLPRYGEHIAWAESSAVTFANSVIGARTNREGGPSALAAGLIGKTPSYGLHLEENRRPTIHIEVSANVETLPDFGALGYVIGTNAKGEIPYITGIKDADTDKLKSFSASVITYGSKPIFHMEEITPEAEKYSPPKEKIMIDAKQLKEGYEALNDEVANLTFVCIGCPHASIKEIAEVAEVIKGKKVKDGMELWVCTARPMKSISDNRGYTKVIEDAGGKFACDTCMVVAPLKGRFDNVVTTSAKACFYSRGKNKMATKIGSIEQCIDTAVSGLWK
ncbi:MAG: aconitase X catalytic domain-containing protein [Candidatus Altiarchaeota archaeon]